MLFSLIRRTGLGLPDNFELRLRRYDGEYRSFETRVVPIRYDLGASSGCHVRVDRLEPKREAPQAWSQDRLQAGGISCASIDGYDEEVSETENRMPLPLRWLPRSQIQLLVRRYGFPMAIRMSL